MINNNNDLVMEWYRFAMMDWATAKYICNMQPKPLEIICYHCQQSAEKILKGFLTSNGIEPPKTHDLPLLCDMCIEISDIFREVYDVCEFLTQYGSQPRYPNEIEVVEADAEKAIKSVQEMIDFFEKQGVDLK